MKALNLKLKEYEEIKAQTSFLYFDLSNFRLAKHVYAHNSSRLVNSIIFYENDKFISCANDNFINQSIRVIVWHPLIILLWIIA